MLEHFVLTERGWVKVDEVDIGRAERRQHALSGWNAPIVIWNAVRHVKCSRVWTSHGAVGLDDGNTVVDVGDVHACQNRPEGVESATGVQGTQVQSAA